MVEAAGFNLMDEEEVADWSCRNSLGNMGEAMGRAGVEALVSVGFSGFRSDLDSEVVVVEEKVRKNTNTMGDIIIIPSSATSKVRPTVLSLRHNNTW